MRGTPSIALILAILFFPHEEPLGQEDGREGDRRFRRERETWMKSERSPLALARLFWLKPGENRFGVDAANDIILPEGTAPGKVGRFLLDKEQVRLLVDNPTAAVILGNQEVRDRILKADSAGTPDVVHLGDLRMRILQRGNRFAVRLVYTKNPPLLVFKRLDFFDIDPAYRIEARFVPYQPPKKVQITSVTGQIEGADCPGVAQFTLEGKDFSLEPILESPKSKQLFFIFKDLTNGQETYEAGRFLYTDLPKGNSLILNFNQAHNPYCAYSPYSTCPLPPRQNWLKAAIKAGEKKYPHP